MHSIWRVKYAILDYEYRESDGAYGEIKEEIVGINGLTRIEMQCEDGLSWIIEKELIKSEKLSQMVRVRENIDGKGGTEVQRRPVDA